MKHSIHSLIAISSILVLLAPACTNQFSEAAKSMKAPRNFTAEMGEEDATKTMLADNGTSVLWQPNDDINAFYGNTRIGRYTNYSDGAVTVAVFEGDGKSFIGATEDEGTKKNYWAVYPYNYKNTSDGESVTATLPDFQTATADNFAKGTLLTVAKSETTVLQFYHVCGGIKFSVTHPGIRQVELMGNNNEVLAGQLTITMDDNKRPVVTAVAEPQKTIRLTARNGDSFQVGKWYYITCLPVAFSQGFTLTLRSATETGVYTYSEPIEVKRAIWGSLSDVDDAVSYSPEDNKIEFPAPTEILYTSTTNAVVPADPEAFDAELIDNFYIDGLGHLVFEKGVTTVGEYCFFTGNSFMDDNHEIKSIILPYGIKRIDSGAFMFLSALSQVVIPSTVSEIGADAFFSTNITSIDLPEGLSVVSSRLFYKCHGLASICLPSTIERIEDHAFYDCKNLKNIDIPENCKSIEAGAFSNTSLQQIYIPNDCILSVSTGFGSDAIFYGCKKLTRFNGTKASEDGRCLIQNDTLVAIATYGLESYEIPEGVTHIQYNAFTNDNLSSLTLPSSIKSLDGHLSFHGNLTVKSTTPPVVSEYIWFYTDDLAIYVPAGSINDYKNAIGWKNYADYILAIPES